MFEFKVVRHLIHSAFVLCSHTQMKYTVIVEFEAYFISRIHILTVDHFALMVINFNDFNDFWINSVYLENILW